MRKIATVKVLLVSLLTVALVVVPLVLACTKPAPAPTKAPAPAKSPAPPAISKEGWPKAATWGGSAAGATYTVLGAAMARMIEKYVGVTSGCEPLGGGAANILALHKKEIEFSLIVTTDSYDAPRGLGEYKEKGSVKICSLFAAHHFLFTGYARTESKINSIADWRGKRVMCKNPATALPFRFTSSILPAYGMTLNDITVQPLPGTSDRMVAITEKTTDIQVAPLTESTPYLIEIFQRVPCNFIPLDTDKLETMIKNDPVWYKATMPAGSYKGQDKDILMAGMDIIAACRADLPESFVYEVMKAIWGHFDSELKPMHPDFKFFEGEKLVHKSTAPFHPGAIKYWKEVGVWDAAAQKRQDDLLKELAALGVKY